MAKAMPQSGRAVTPVAAVSAVLVHEGRILMVRRRNPPKAGRLALPGGKIESGERLLDAAVRELLEETGVRALPREVLTAMDVLEHGDQGELLSHHVIVVIRMAWQGGQAVAADDASELCWIDKMMLERLGGEVCDTAVTVARRVLEGYDA